MSLQHNFNASVIGFITAVILMTASVEAIAETQIKTADKGSNLIIQIVEVRTMFDNYWEPKEETSLRGYSRVTTSDAELPRIEYIPGPRSPLYSRGATSGFHDFYLKIYNSHNQVSRQVTLQGSVGYELWKLFKATTASCPITLEIDRDQSTLVSVEYACSLDE